MSTYEKLLDKAEELGWSHWEDENGGVELEKHSPAGEDFLFYACDKGNLAKEAREYADAFDIEEHIRGLLNAKADGFAGVPDLKTLVEDADDIQKMLDELADALEEIECESDGGDEE